MDTSPDGRFVATVGEDGTVVLLDATTLEELRRAPTVEGENNLGAIAFAPDGDTFVVGTEDGTVAEFRTDNFEPTGRSVEAGILVFGVRRAGHDRVLAMIEGGEPDTYAVMTADLATGETNRLEVPVPLSAAALDPSGRFAGIAGDDGRVAIIDVRRGELVGPAVLGHDGPVGRVAFSPDGTVMASGGFDGILAFWDVASGQLLATAHPGASNVFLFPVFDTDGTVRTASNDGTTTEFASDAESWVARACRVAGRDLTEEEWTDAFSDRPYEATCPVGS
jgi:WD40 repeat protein